MLARISSVLFNCAFALSSVIGGCAIVFISIGGGGTYALLKSGGLEVTDEVVISALLTACATYQVIIGMMLIHIVQAGRTRWKFRSPLSAIAATPLVIVIFFLNGVISLAISLFLLTAIATMMVYQSLVTFYRR